MWGFPGREAGHTGALRSCFVVLGVLARVRSSPHGGAGGRWDVPSIRGSSEDSGIEYNELIIDVSRFSKYFQSSILMSV